MNRPLLLQIDDDGYFAAMYRQELEDEFDVEFCGRADEAMEAVRRGTPYAAILLDIMMAPPSADLRAETDDGLSTGVWLLRQVRDEVIRRGVPVVVLTNRTDDRLADEIASLDMPDGLLECHFKGRTSAMDLPVIVRRLLTA